MEPRKVIGSIDTAEFLVALAASLGFLVRARLAGHRLHWVAGLLVGGSIAAPLAAWLVRHIPPRMLGSLVGGMIVLTNTRTLLKSDWIDAADATRYAVYAVLYAVWAPPSCTPSASTARTAPWSPPRPSPPRRRARRNRGEST